MNNNQITKLDVDLTIESNLGFPEYITENIKLKLNEDLTNITNKTINDFRQFVRDSNLVFLAEGHANAFGFGIYEKDFEDFIIWSDNQLKDIEFSPSYKVDFIYSMSDINSKDILELGNSKYLWG